MNPDTILALLQTAACETEEESDVSPNLTEKYNAIFKIIFMILEIS